MTPATLVTVAAAPATWRYRRTAPGAAVPRPFPARRQILVGDALERLRQLPTASVDCVITSPPYFQLRDYGVDGQIGLETHVDDWVEHLRAVIHEVARVLKPTGSLWLNIGDSYSRHQRYGARPKSLLLGPERLLLALMADGWVVRNKVIWAKLNPMPHSVSDRLNMTWEGVFFLVRSASYNFDLDAIRQPHRSSRRASPKRSHKYGADRHWAGPLAGSNAGLERAMRDGRAGHPLGKNPGDVWTLATAGYRGAHFATFPESLVEGPLLATCPEQVCSACGRAWRRGRPSCQCRARPIPGLVLDPFFGAGTVGLVAERLGRDWVGIELNPEFAALAEQRIAARRAARADEDEQQTNHRKEVS